MKEYKYYCDLCEKEHQKWDFIPVQIKVSYGYDAGSNKVGTRSGKEDMNICKSCAKSLGFKEKGGAEKWCNGVRRMFLNLQKLTRIGYN